MTPALVNTPVLKTERLIMRAPQATGFGYAREAPRAVIAHAFGPLGWNTAVSYIAPDNARSIALAERLETIRNDSAAHPGDTPCLVYRHPKPEAA